MCECACCKKWEQVYSNQHNKHAELRNHLMAEVKKLKHDLANEQNKVNLYKQTYEKK
jgi:hypothetical protein